MTGGQVTPRAALLFMRRCRQPTSYTSTHKTRSYHTVPSTSEYAPSTFNNQPFTTPLASHSPYPQPASNLPGPGSKAAFANPILSPTSHPSSLSTRPRAISTPIPPAHSATNFRNWLRRRLGIRIPTKGEPAPDPFNVWNNPYRAHKQWPPALHELSRIEQFAMEKVFKRRVALKWKRPIFTKWVKLIQHGGVAVIAFCFVFLVDLEEGTIFDGVRTWVWRQIAESEVFPGAVRERAREQVQNFGKKWEAMVKSFFEIVPQPGMVPGGIPEQIVNPEDVKVPWAQRKKRES